MSIDPNMLIAAKIVHDECDKNICCNKCQLCDICYDTCPNNWNIPTPPPEPTERPRIEWLRMLPDKEMMMAIVEKNVLLSCKDCDICPNCSPCTGNECNVGHMNWWYEVVTLEQFRKDVGLK
jgi:ferredoxin